MKQLTILEKSGFQSRDGKIRIYDAQKRPFYFKQVNNGYIAFNLPIGVYFTDNSISKLNSPVVYSLPEIPKPNRYLPLPSKPFKIVYKSNPNKCSVLLNGGVFMGVIYNEPAIIFDITFKKYPSCVIHFIIKHEYAHVLYGGFTPNTSAYINAEANCDTVARRLMLIEGFNPSQLDIITKITLSDKQHYRLKCSYEQNLKSANYGR